MISTNFMFQHFAPTKIVFGAGKLNSLHEEALPGKMALIVISNGKSTRANGYLARLEAELDQAGVGHVVFDGVGANPTKTAVMAGSVAAREAGADCIVALGGGSVMDASKAIAAMAVNDGDLWEYILFGTGGKKPLANKPLPLVAVTTTAGTGSEVDNYGVITNEETNEKTAYCDANAFPVLAVVDPELMLSVPPKFTAYQGFDALFHSTEAYISNLANLKSDMLARAAIENVGVALARAVRDGSDLDARTRMAFANTMSGLVMLDACTTSEHSLEHALSAYHGDLPHGAGLILISRAYYTFFINKHVCDDRFIEMARMLGKTEANAPMDFVEVLVKLQEECGVADLKMSDYGITPDEFPKMVRNAKDCMGLLFPFDRYQLSDEECIQILTDSYR